MEDHILKTHIGHDRIPYNCRLCMFKCMTQHQMNHHMNHYSRHLTRAREPAVTNHQEWMEASPIPYKIGETDLLKLSQEESVVFFLKKQSGEQSPVTATVEVLQMSAASPDQLARVLSSDTLLLGYISASPVIRGHQSAVIPFPDHRSSRMGQAPAIPVVPGATQDFTTETEDPITLEGVNIIKGGSKQGSRARRSSDKEEETSNT